PNGSVVYGITIFGQREYYRRIYKLLSEWNRRGVEYPIDFTQHITNTQTLPFNTWATATLDLEQRAQTEDPDKVTAEVVIAKKDEKSKPKPQGYQLPWPPDYTRTVTFGRQSGTIPLVLDLVSGHLRHDADQYTTQMMLRDWAMRRIHDIRKGGDYMKSANLAKEYENCLIDFGYGKLDQVTHHNYWAEKPFVSVDDDRVKWLALEKKVAEKVSGVSVQNEKAMNTGNPEQKTDTRHPPARRSSPGEGGTPDISFGLLLLQSYSRTEAVNVAVTFPGAAVFQDVETKEIIPAPGGKAQIAMPANFATRMFLVSRNAEALKSSPTENNVQK
ncbi:MAG: hypothetical protein WCP55_23680, partial [Lentisphaerota bacterium]